MNEFLKKIFCKSIKQYTVKKKNFSKLQNQIYFLINCCVFNSKILFRKYFD